MSPADRPYLTRPLAGVDQALGDGRARQPVELLDQLRGRLDRLEPNHPSAAQPAGDLAQTQASEVQASRPDRPSPRKEGADSSPGDQAGDHGAGQPPAVRQAEWPAAADAGTGLTADGQYPVVDARRARPDERYRPWFADEPGAPWFTEPGHAP